MAITILGQPTTPNVTNTKLVYSISSSNATEPQFQYVTQVLRGANVRTRLNTYPNSFGTGIVEISQILSDNINYDDPVIPSTNGLSSASLAYDGLSFDEFTIRFGESYGTSISSSVTDFLNLASTTIEVFPGTVDPNNGVSYNWPDSGSEIKLLSDMIEGYISKDAFNGFSFYACSGSTGQLTVQYVNSAGSILGGFDFNLAVSPSLNTIFNVAFGSGSLFYNTWTQDWDKINIIRNSPGPVETLSTIHRVYDCNPDEIQTFTFINNYGYYDSYTVPNPVRRVTNVNRKTFDQPSVRYDAPTSIASTYDITRRGETQYSTGYTDRYEITTDYLNKATADWLTQMVESPSAFVQVNGQFVPIIVTNSSYTWNMNQARQKLYQLTIEYKYANQRYER